MLSDNHRHGGGSGDGNKLPLSSLLGVLGNSTVTYIGEENSPASPGTQTVTGVGFEPSVVLFLSHSNKSSSIGFANGTSDKALYRLYDSNDIAIADWSIRVQNAASAYSAATLQSTNSDGFVLNWTTIGSVSPFAFLCIK